MRINVNLASNPYEVAQEYTRRMGMLVAGLALLTLVLVGYILYQRSHTRDVNRQIAEARQEISALDAEKAQAQAVLNRPQNRSVVDQSQFLNNLFARKALSWTKVFAEMEKLMPPNIHVLSMKPEFNRDNQLVLHVVVVGSARDKAVELVKRMEKSRHFRAPQVEAETAVAESGASALGGNIQFDIAAVYVPFVDDSDAAKDEKSKDEKTEEKAGTKGAATATTAGAAGGVR